MTINKISYRDIDIDITCKTTKGETYLEWSFVRLDKRYGNALKFSSVKKDQLIGAVATLVANACRTYEDLLRVSDTKEITNENPTTN